jgi:hypothetical protein
VPYVINWPPAKRSGIRAAAAALAALFATAVAGVAAAPAMADTSSCSPATLTQPFTSWGDFNWYTLAPGESIDSFDGTGWTLNNGASVESQQLNDGSTGNVLDLPGGSSAVSPPMCVDLTYQKARTMVRNLGGWGGVLFAVSYQNSDGSWPRPQLTGWLGVHHSGWELSRSVDLQPSSASGWQIVQFTFISVGPSSDSQLYDFYVDPYAKG